MLYARSRILETLLFWHYDFSSLTRSVVFAVCFAGLWVGASVRLLRRNVVPRFLLACLCLVAMLFLVSLLYESAVEAREKSGVILAAGLTARKGDGYGFAPAFNEPLPAGTEFTLVEDRSGWYQI